MIYRDKEHIKIDANGVYMRVDSTGITDISTNQKIQMIVPEDIEYDCQIGSGNGGIVKLAYHRTEKFPMAVKIINVYDKEKRHQLYNELKMVKLFGSQYLITCYGAFF